ncbi:unnamed protein product [Citrullus colocynthis]|uniref:60S acidic ribosomal protein P3 n=1 Tax=Citrullus colocynthis TaxID=252529 RepID=A0ABP0YZ50_9ROSI
MMVSSVNIKTTHNPPKRAVHSQLSPFSSYFSSSKIPIRRSNMGVFTFVCRSSGGKWTANQYSGDLEGSADSTYELQRKLVQSALSVDSSGGVQSSFSLITPTSAVFQVIVGGGSGGGFIGGGGGAAAAPAGGDAPAAAEAPAEKKEDVKEESDDDDLGLSLFD